MCVDCNKETLTGVVYYSGDNFTICNNITITNGEDMNVVLSKIEQCLDFINTEIDITGITENSDCIAFTGTKLKDILRGLINTSSDFCDRIALLESKVSDLEDELSTLSSDAQKEITITTCENNAVTKTISSDTVDFKFNVGLVPRRTILPYFGPRSDFDGTGLGIGSMRGWAISNGSNGTIDACNKFIHYECDICCGIYGGSNEITINTVNLPDIQQNGIELSLTGTTSSDGLHNHNMAASSDNGDDYYAYAMASDGADCLGETRIIGPNPIEPTDTVNYCNLTTVANSTTPVLRSGVHSHTFSSTGSFSIDIQNDNEPISYMPEHIKAIPIEFVGCL